MTLIEILYDIVDSKKRNKKIFKSTRAKTKNSGNKFERSHPQSRVNFNKLNKDERFNRILMLKSEIEDLKELVNIDQTFYGKNFHFENFFKKLGLDLTLHNIAYSIIRRDSKCDSSLLEQMIDFVLNSDFKILNGDLSRFASNLQVFHENS